MRHESRRRVTMGADVEMKDGDKKMETKEEEKKAEPVKTLDVLDVRASQICPLSNPAHAPIETTRVRARRLTIARSPRLSIHSCSRTSRCWRSRPRPRASPASWPRCSDR